MSLIFLRSIPLKQVKNCAGIFKQYMGARNQVEIEFSYRPGGIGSLESILGFLKSYKIRALRRKVRGGGDGGRRGGGRVEPQREREARPELEFFFNF